MTSVQPQLSRFFSSRESAHFVYAVEPARAQILYGLSDHEHPGVKLHLWFFVQDQVNPGWDQVRR